MQSLEVGPALGLCVSPQWDFIRSAYSLGVAVVLDVAVHQRSRGELARALPQLGCNNQAVWLCTSFKGLDSIHLVRAMDSSRLIRGKKSSRVGSEMLGRCLVLGPSYSGLGLESSRTG